MTVKSLTEAEQEMIFLQYTSGLYTVTELAKEYNRSRRTIIRALEDKGASPVIPHKKKPAPVPAVPVPTKTPWWRRFADWCIGETPRTEYRP